MESKVLGLAGVGVGVGFLRVLGVGVGVGFIRVLGVGVGVGSEFFIQLSLKSNNFFIWFCCLVLLVVRFSSFCMVLLLFLETIASVRNVYVHFSPIPNKQNTAIGLH